MYSYSGLLRDAVQRGYDGLNIGIPFTISRLNKPTGGIAKGMYYLLLGASRTGKSALLYDQFIFNLVDRIFDGKMRIEDVEIVLYSLEIDRVMIVTKAAIRFLFYRRNILTTIKKTLGIEKKVNDELYSLIMNDADLQRYLSILESVLFIMTKAEPRAMYNYIYGRCVEQSTQYGVDPEGNELYTFTNPNKIFIVAVDHIALAQGGKDLDSTKKVIDAISQKVMVNLKRQFGIVPVMVQQINPQKQGDGKKKLIYGHADARDSKDTFQDCDVCMSLGSPYHMEFESVHFNGLLYYVAPSEASGWLGLEDRLRMFGIEKDRYGTSNLLIPAAFVGEIGAFGDMPDPDNVVYDKYKFAGWQRL